MCACCDCNSSCHGRTARENPLKAKALTEIEHGLENRFAGLPISCTDSEVQEQEKNPKTDETYRAVSMFVSPVRTTIKGLNQIVYNLTQYALHLHDHKRLGQFCDILPILQTFRGFTTPYLSNKKSAKFTYMEFPPSITIAFVDDSFSGRKAICGKTSNSSEISEVCACDFAL